MKNILVAIVVVVALCACDSSEQKALAYRGLPMDLPFQTFCDSLQARGYAVDSAKTDSAFEGHFGDGLDHRQPRRLHRTEK